MASVVPERRDATVYPQNESPDRHLTRREFPSDKLPSSYVVFKSVKAWLIFSIFGWRMCFARSLHNTDNFT